MNKIVMFTETRARCAISNVIWPFTSVLLGVRVLIYVRIDIYCHAKTNYLATRNKHITNYQFFQ